MRSGDPFEKKHSLQMRQANGATEFLFSAALNRVVSSGKPALVLMRGRDNKIALLTISPRRSHPKAQAPRLEATGVLGLYDRIAQDIEEKEERSWWKKLLGD